MKLHTMKQFPSQILWASFMSLFFQANYSSGRLAGGRGIQHSSSNTMEQETASHITTGTLRTLTITNDHNGNEYIHIPNTYCQYYEWGGDGPCVDGLPFDQVWQMCLDDQDQCMGVMWNSCEGQTSDTTVNGAWKLMGAGQIIGDAQNPTPTCGGQDQALGHWDVFVRPDMYIDNTSGGSNAPDPIMKVEVSVTTDQNPEDTHWTIRKSNNETISSTSSTAFATVVTTAYLESSACHEFTIFDSWGDGLRDGDFVVKVNDFVVLSNPDSPFNSLHVELCNTVPIVQIDFSNPDAQSNTDFELKNGAEIKAAPGNSFDALRIDSDGPYALVPGVDISPSQMTDCTLMVGLYLESIANVHGWVFGNEQSGYDRSILMHDYRFSSAISSAVGHRWTAWANPQNPPLHQWIHVTAVFRQGGESYVFLNGIRSDNSVIGDNNDGKGELWIGRPHHSNHWVDSWIKEVMVFDSALSDEDVASYADKFIQST